MISQTKKTVINTFPNAKQQTLIFKLKDLQQYKHVILMEMLVICELKVTTANYKRKSSEVQNQKFLVIKKYITY